ncbi:hypothetical protein PR048_024023 [Dryococelus australis]|uniref:Uncharacterized protein n=1 Tax=Dryococelus australis TaxID=614101 RepID=A0ABQ9GVW2_9NEOP|nr:hypothetical protein PR048_024023 [Dryococelus australis]
MAMRKQGELEAAWTNRGKILKKKTAESKLIQVKDIWSLDDACNARKLPQCKLYDFLFPLDHDLANCKKIDTFILSVFTVNMCEQNSECTLYKVIYRSNGFNILNTLPTRINNTIDHVMTNTTQKNTIICNIENTLSDHYAVLTTICHSSYDTNTNKRLEYILGKLRQSINERQIIQKYKKKRNNSNIKLELGELNNRLTMLKR